MLTLPVGLCMNGPWPGGFRGAERRCRAAGDRARFLHTLALFSSGTSKNKNGGHLGARFQGIPDQERGKPETFDIQGLVSGPGVKILVSVLLHL